MQRWLKSRDGSRKLANIIGTIQFENKIEGGVETIL